MPIEHTGGASEAGIAAGIGEFLRHRLVGQQQKEREERERQWDLEAEQRARLWEIEKMEIRSRLDFEREERQRQQKLDEIDAAMKQIDETDRIPDNKKEAYKEMLYMKKLGVNVPTRMISPELYQKQLTPAQQALQQLLSGGEITAPTGQDILAGPGEIYVTAPTGETGKIPVEDWSEAAAQGYTLAPGQTFPKSKTFQKYATEWEEEKRKIELKKHYPHIPPRLLYPLGGY